ncbi:MAG TPA: DUF2934 domain-containing protein [Stellaceae bacterium]|nr:DUF2934 domain-containing protein [Stellaceae bacterium]
MTAERDGRIRERAYHIWLAEGRVAGRHDEHWHRAEREIADEEMRMRPTTRARNAAPAKRASTTHAGRSRSRTSPA